MNFPNPRKESSKYAGQCDLPIPSSYSLVMLSHSTNIPVSKRSGRVCQLPAQLEWLACSLQAYLRGIPASHWHYDDNARSEPTLFLPAPGL